MYILNVSLFQDDELQSTVVNYKQQLNMLTEHVGNLNDKLAQQFEEIQHLKESSSAKKWMWYKPYFYYIIVNTLYYIIE